MLGKGQRRIKYYVILILLLLPIFSEAINSDLEPFDQVLINSWDWRDVYQGIMFARLIGKPVDFVVSPEMAVQVVESLPKKDLRILLLQPNTKQQYTGFAQLLENNGYEVYELEGRGSIGLRLAESLDVKNIIITDERYPYNAVSLAPYALQLESYVHFADATTIDEIENVIQNKQAKVTIYGIVDSQVTETLDQYNPVIINLGGKFDNNLYVAREFLKLKNDTQVIITNGEFIELALIDDFNAVVFVGKTNVPKQVEDFFVQENITHGVIVGNYLATLVEQLTDRLERIHNKDISILVRFAKTPRVLTGPFNEPVSLEYFNLPIIDPELKIINVAYNRLTKELEVTYENPSQIPVFFIGTFSLIIDGESISVGDEEPNIVVAGQQKTFLYEVGIDADSLSGEGFFIYGDYPKSLEFQFSEKFSNIPVISVADESSFEIKNIIYDKTDKAFYITVFNPGDVGVHAQLELVDIVVDGLPTTLGTRDSFKLAALEERVVFIRAKLSNLDIIENEEVLVRGLYGQRPNILFKETEKSFTLKVRLIKTGYLIVGVSILVILLLVLLYLFARKKDYRCQKCNLEQRSRLKPNRHHCGGNFYRKK